MQQSKVAAHVEVPVSSDLDAQRDLLALLRDDGLVHVEVLDGGGEGVGGHAGRLGCGVPGGDDKGDRGHEDAVVDHMVRQEAVLQRVCNSLSGMSWRLIFGIMTDCY